MAGYPSPPNYSATTLALEMLHRSGSDLVAVYRIENPAGTPRASRVHPGVPARTPASVRETCA